MQKNKGVPDSSANKEIDYIMKKMRKISSEELSNAFREALMTAGLSASKNFKTALKIFEIDLYLQRLDLQTIYVPRVVNLPRDRLGLFFDLLLKMTEGEVISGLFLDIISGFPNFDFLREHIFLAESISSFEKTFVHAILLSPKIVAEGHSEGAVDNESIGLLQKLAEFSYIDRLYLLSKCSNIKCLLGEIHLDSNMNQRLFSNWLNSERILDFQNRRNQTMSDNEALIESLENTLLQWDGQEQPTFDPKVSGQPFVAGSLSVPIDYGENQFATFKIRVRRHILGEYIGKKVHVIYVSGGPGGKPKLLPSFLMFLSYFKDELMLYTVDQRGTSQSGRESLQKPDNEKTKDDLSPEHITLYNTTHDFATFVRHIRKLNPDSRIILYGDSYGAEIVNAFVSLFPNSVEAVVMSGAPPIYGVTEEESFYEFILDCELHSFCASKMGLDAKKTLDNAVRILLENSNACTAELHKVARELLNYKSQDDVNWRLLFNSLMSDGSVADPRERTLYSPAQILFPLLKSTADCTDVSEYRDVVVNEIRRILTDLSWKASKGVYALVQYIDILGFTHETKPADPPSDFASLYWARDSATAWQLVKEAFPQRSNFRRTHERPAMTGYIEVYFLSCRKDLVTPPNSSYDLFTKVDAPIKKWLLLPHCGHCSHGGVCYHYYLIQVLFGVSLMELTECMKSNDIPTERMELDWTFRHLGKQSNWSRISSMWDLVNTEIEEDQVEWAISGSNRITLPAAA